MRTIAFAIFYLATEVSLMSRRREGSKLSVAGLITDSALNIIALGGFAVCMIAGA